jgi:ubiquinone/menaquinone biosynthesis C-methylase UbiE
MLKTAALSGRKDEAETAWINERISNQLGLTTGQRVVDIGCGDGSLLNSVVGVSGVGVTPFQNEYDELSRTHPHLTFKLASSTKLPMKDGWADRAIMNGVFPHLSNIDEAEQSVSEAARVIKKGGLFWLGEVRCGINPEFAVLGSRRLGLYIHQFTALNFRYFRHCRKGVKLLKTAFLVSTPALQRMAARHSLSLVWQEPSYRILDGKKLLSPIRRDYVFAKT